MEGGVVGAQPRRFSDEAVLLVSVNNAQPHQAWRTKGPDNLRSKVQLRL
jgi:hypothetical protein